MTKALVATRRSQGERDGDYMFGIPGELVWLPEVCDTDRYDPEHGCGCGRGFGGLASHRAMTTAEVAELAMSEEELRLAFETSLRDQGWIAPDESPGDVEEILAETLGVVRSVAAQLPTGTLVRREVDNLHAFPARAG